MGDIFSFDNFTVVYTFNIKVNRFEMSRLEIQILSYVAVDNTVMDDYTPLALPSLSYR